MRALKILLCLLSCLLVAGALVSVPLGAANAMKFAYYSAVDKGGAGLLVASGRVVGGDADRLQSTLRTVPAGMRLAGLSLNSPGGNLEEGLRMATIVRGARLTTMVLDDAMCASACFNVFAAGPIRFASTQARIGVHSASVGGKDDVLAQAATVRAARQLADFEVPEAILGKLIAATPDQVWWLDRATLESMKVNLHPPLLTLQPVADTPVAPAPFGSAVLGAAAPKSGFRVDRGVGGFSFQRPTGGFQVAKPGSGG